MLYALRGSIATRVRRAGLAVGHGVGTTLWEGDLTPLASGGTIDVDGQSFRTLEALFLPIAGERYPTLEWL